MAMEKYAKQTKDVKQMVESEGVDNPRLDQFNLLKTLFDQASYESLNEDEMLRMFKVWKTISKPADSG